MFNFSAKPSEIMNSTAQYFTESFPSFQKNIKNFVNGETGARGNLSPYL
jgi:hypothetical protein